MNELTTGGEFDFQVYVKDMDESFQINGVSKIVVGDEYITMFKSSDRIIAFFKKADVISVVKDE